MSYLKRHLTPWAFQLLRVSHSAVYENGATPLVKWLEAEQLLRSGVWGLLNIKRWFYFTGIGAIGGGNAPCVE